MPPLVKCRWLRRKIIKNNYRPLLSLARSVSLTRTNTQETRAIIPLSLGEGKRREKSHWDYEYNFLFVRRAHTFHPAIGYCDEWEGKKHQRDWFNSVAVLLGHFAISFNRLHDPYTQSHLILCKRKNQWAIGKNYVHQIKEECPIRKVVLLLFFPCFSCLRAHQDTVREKKDGWPNRGK